MHFAEMPKNSIFGYAKNMAADTTRKRLYLVTARGTIDSIDYDGGDQVEVYNRPTRGSHTLDIFENLLYYSNTHSDHVVEFNVSSGNIHRFITFVNGSYPSDVVVVHTTVEIDGKFLCPA